MKIRSQWIVRWKGKWEILYHTAVQYFITENGKIKKISDAKAYKLY